MPSTYAHYRFGEAVFQKLPAPQQELVAQHKNLFAIGLHGPDILFYYRPLFRNKLGRMGGILHERSGRSFFEPAGKKLIRHEWLPEDTAYLYGFLCHFALDVACHGYIDEKITQSGVSHAEIEGEFDRYLLVQEGKDPLTEDLIASVHPTKEAASVIRHYFPATSKEEIWEALRSMVFYHHLLYAPTRAKRTILYTGLKLLGQYEHLHGHIINERPNPACADSNRILWERMQEAVPQAVALITSYRDTVRGKIPWDDVYSYNFESQPKDDSTERGAL